MLRCPKCSRVSQDGAQKFCTEDGARLTFADQTVEEMPKHQSPRLTPPGELLSEVSVSPSDNLFIETAPPANRTSTLSFQSFGLYSSNSSAVLRGSKTTNGFHSFNSQIVEDTETKVGGARPTLNSNDSLYKNFANASDENDKQKVGATFIIICLLGALLFLTGLAFAASYFFGEQGKASSPQTRETSFIKSSKAENVTLASSTYSFSLTLIPESLGCPDAKKV